MNTATRVMPAVGIIKWNSFSLPMTGINMGVWLLIIGLLLSAFSVVYLKDLNRRLFIQSQSLQQVQNQYEVEWGKLLLEQSTWSAQSRIQQIAQTKLHMVMPSAKNIVMVQMKSSG